MDCNCPAGQSLYPTNLGDCSAASLGSIGLLCTSTPSGFVGDPGCGGTGTFETCMPVLLAGIAVACNATVQSVPVKQQCH